MSKLFLGALTLFAVCPTFAVDLMPGSQAPKLEIKEWVKGTPIKEFQKDKIYVVEFWATWCGPCLETIPHLTALAKQNPKVTFIGVGIWEDNKDKKVQAFVKQMGDKMGYQVGYSGDKDGMAKTWMEASGQNGIPASFIIKNGQIQWIGHPMGLGKVLGSGQNGDFDVATARASYEKRMAAQKEAEERGREIEACAELFDAGKREEAKARLAKVESTPKGKAETSELRFKWLSVENLPAWKVDAEAKIESAQDEGSMLSPFIYQNAAASPEACRWLAQKLTQKFPKNWYPWLCGARMHRILKDFDQALVYTQKSREAILDFQKANPDAPKGNALDVLKALEDQIRKEKGGAGK